jgi:hypothetical protein
MPVRLDAEPPVSSPAWKAGVYELITASRGITERNYAVKILRFSKTTHAENSMRDEQNARPGQIFWLHVRIAADPT